MSLKSHIIKLARTEANKVVRNETSIRDLKASQCNIMGKVSKVTVEDGQVILTVLLADGTSITANASGIGKPLGPGSSVLVVNGIVVV